MIENRGLFTPEQKISIITIASKFHDRLFPISQAAGNHLFAFAQVEREEQIEGIASSYSVRTHRALAARVRDEFGLIDPYLRKVGPRVFADADSLRASGDVVHEEYSLRRVIHMTALNETLGGAAKQYFDPYALIPKY